MKKLFTFVITVLFCASLAFAQATGGSPGKQSGTGRKGTTQADAASKDASKTKTRKGHKGGKKGKKSSGGTTTPAPK